MLYTGAAADQIAIIDVEAGDEINTDEGIAELKASGGYDAQARSDQGRATSELSRAFEEARRPYQTLD